MTVLVAFFGCVAYVLLSFNSYLRISHKDMAILRHAGFTARQVRRMYSGRVLRVFMAIAIGTIVYESLLAIWLLPSGVFRFLALNTLLTGLLLTLMCAVVLRSVRRHTRLGVLTLLRGDKEFE